MNDRLWKECQEFHGHACGGLAIGFRAAETAAELLGFDLERAEDEELVCVAESDMCGLDCIQWMLACTVGKGNLILRPRGKTAFSFFDRRTGKGIRLVLRPFDRDRPKEEVIAEILAKPYGELFEVKEPGFEVPEKARLFDNVVCCKCGESVREDMVRLQKGRPYCLDCFPRYDRGWM